MNEPIAERRFCLVVVRYLSTIVMDPHLYFEQKWIAELQSTEEPAELLGLARQLIGWIDTVGLTDTQADRLDALLADERLPDLRQMRDRVGE